MKDNIYIDVARDFEAFVKEQKLKKEPNYRLVVIAMYYECLHLGQAFIFKKTNNDIHIDKIKTHQGFRQFCKEKKIVRNHILDNLKDLYKIMDWFRYPNVKLANEAIAIYGGQEIAYKENYKEATKHYEEIKQYFSNLLLA